MNEPNPQDVRTPARDETPDERVIQVHRIGALLVAAVIAVFGILGLSGDIGFFDTEGGSVVGLSTNGFLSTVSLVTAVVLIVAAARSGRLVSTVMAVVGVLFLLSALAHFFVLGTRFNILAFTLPNIFFSMGAGLTLLLLGSYGRVTARLPVDNPYYLDAHRNDPPRVDDDYQPPTSEEASVDRAMAEAERAAAQHLATDDQRSRVRAMGRVLKPEDRRQAWLSLGPVPPAPEPTPPTTPRRSGPVRQVLVAGASGFVGQRLCPELVEAGYRVRAMTRHPERYDGAGEPVRGDVHDPAQLAAALEGCDAAYYLVHSLGDANFERRDADAARTFAQAAADAGVARIVYLGGLGDDADDLSAHLRSRREMEELLASTDVPVTTLRAGIIVGSGGISWEMTRQLVEHLPAMITPRWVRTLTQPIAVADVIRYLVGVLELPEADGRAFDIGGPEVLAYVDMMRRVARIEGRTMIVVPVPVLSPRVSAWWLSLVTNVDLQTGKSLIESMGNEVVVRDDSIRALVPFEPMGYDESVLSALGERARAARASVS